ncbi:ABC-type nitrate/sulfonate/bicarbonate transport system permease component [Nonomuraea fuscirosea]|uniref:ABC-type nitrate/sulfonate/bicarbonate transport system permease component n=1 Tax=Nonomuraea fuscirosea TaxID=1291556 RepID=A0A2T0LXS9_9ACTN|nr:ABC transporter permease subunit [Nonomuraea fuscirosea]PRX48926.1 ABC-type nitrate/sulfonate/bicarbonate transport system permease component [Nonomuraea fuscirosea]
MTPHRYRLLRPERPWARALPALAATAALIAWEVITRIHHLLYFPPPSTVIARAYDLWFAGAAFLTDQAIEDLLPSLTRLALGWTLAAALGLTAGIALGLSPVLAALTNPILHIGRAIPPPALLPLFLATIPIGTPIQLATIIYAVTWPILITTADGIRSIDRAFLDTATVFRLQRRRRLLSVLIPAAAPRILAGLRLSVSLALIMMVVSELAASTDGLGYRLQQAAGTLDIPAMWAVIVLLGTAGITANTAFLRLQRHLLRSRQVAPAHGHT